MKRSMLSVLVTLTITLVGCGDGDGGDGAEWGYDGKTGPDHWGDLSPDYAACAHGAEQSPIGLSSSIAPSTEPPLETDYHSTPLVIFNNGHTIEVEYHEGSSLTVAQQTWEVAQFHFHAHSEHTLDGFAAPLELHIVHRDEVGSLAVVGVFIVEGAPNPALGEIFTHLPAHESEPEEIEGVDVNVADLLPGNLAAWRYHGSLTTPPCTEGVRWHVLAAPIEASAEQIAAFEEIFDRNHRPVQPLGDRQIE
jgi:carbonic anhydrase